VTAGFTPHQIDALASLRLALGVSPWSLIGASAIRCRLPLPRMTYDIDLAVASSDAAMQITLSAAGWTRDERMLQRWNRLGVQVDVVHASQEDIAAGVASFTDGFVLTVVGFDLAFTEVDFVQLDDSFAIPVTRVHAIVLLKMIAWLDRPYERIKDLEDIWFLWDTAVSDDDDFRHDPAHPIGAAGLAYDDHGAFHIGWQLGRVAAVPHLHWTRRFLDAMRDDETAEFGRLVRASRLLGDDAPERVRARLIAFERGLEAGMASVQEVLQTASTPQRRAPPVADVITTSHERAPLTTGVAASSRTIASQLHDAIDQQRVVRFIGKGLSRVAEPHVLGVKNGELQVLVWQTAGSSSSGSIPEWRRFRIQDIRELELLDDTFPGSRYAGGVHSNFDRHVAIVRSAARR